MTGVAHRPILAVVTTSTTPVHRCRAAAADRACLHPGCPASAVRLPAGPEAAALVRVLAGEAAVLLALTALVTAPAGVRVVVLVAAAVLAVRLVLVAALADDAEPRLLDDAEPRLPDDAEPRS